MMIVMVVSANWSQDDSLESFLGFEEVSHFVITARREELRGDPRAEDAELIERNALAICFRETCHCHISRGADQRAIAAEAAAKR